LKRLLVIRHAKSDWNSSALTDFERPLNNRGLRDAPLMGMFLKEKKYFPDFILSSGAKRALTTAEFISKNVGYTKNIYVKNNIYNASAEDIKNVLNEIEEKHNTVFILGHNPGLSNLVYEISGQWIELKTCCVVELELVVNKWNHISKGTAIFKNYYSPKNIV
tara:strand:+ start:463 stop:951 length:489 start_codon:yes stop_codon:yes gene_type:complete